MNINFTDQEINTVGRALALMPYGEVAALVVNIQNQINEQNPCVTTVNQTGGVTAKEINVASGTEPETVE